MPETITLKFGALCDPISKQLAGRGDSETLRRFDHMQDAITTCAVHGLIGDSEITRARKRLLARICKDLGLSARKP